MSLKIQNSSKGISFWRHPILVVGTFSLLSNSELQNSSGKSELILERMFSQFLPGFKKFKNTYQSGIIGNTSKKLTSTLDLKWSRENKWEDIVLPVLFVLGNLSFQFIVFFVWRQKSKIVMKFDLYGTLMINRGNCTPTVFYLSALMLLQ